LQLNCNDIASIIAKNNLLKNAELLALLLIIVKKQEDFPFAERVLTFMNFLPIECRWPVISQAIPKCGSANQRVA
jgi:hypothetical protein